MAGALLSLGTTASPISGASSVEAADKSFAIDALATVAELRSDGSMFVTERVTYRYDGGPYEFGIRSFQRNRNQIDDFTAADEQGPLEVIEPADSISGDWEWKLRGPTSDATVTYTLTYTNHGAGPLSDIIIHDVVPAYSIHVSAAHGTLPNNLTNCAILQPAANAKGNLRWTFTGTLASGGTGTVTFSVKVEN